MGWGVRDAVNPGSGGSLARASGLSPSETCLEVSAKFQAQSCGEMWSTRPWRVKFDSSLLLHPGGLGTGTGAEGRARKRKLSCA